ncbi:acetyl-coenzyme A transporter 1-like [Brachionus plicatilis]|uniref:Acetyl-coenzyme A transporter 1-like n=1 Tax=Brachionus plicatilis TaxID=10195 RepID=A0A3M7SHW7_BRAPC|nr:acetyl-coenzyme A transporter 1-like [Brachionus plicatilis]
MLAQDAEDQAEVLSLYEENLNEKSCDQATKTRDLKNIFFLIFLYIILAIPIGLAFSIPLILSTRKVAYSDQGTYSFAIWPFSLKLLWAPLVDAFFIRKIGRRKTWVVSSQFISGLVMVILASQVNKLIDENIEHQKYDIYLLALIFGFIVFLSATQDVALDAWSLDLLMEYLFIQKNRKNAPLQALCNSFGFGIGQFVGNAGFLIFESVKFSNEYIRPFFNLSPQKHGLVTLEISCMAKLQHYLNL